MWVEKRGDKYLAVDRFIDPMTGKRKRVSVIMDKNTAQSRNKAKEILHAKKTVQKIEQPKTTLKDLETAYIAYQRKLYKESTTKRNEIVLNVVVEILGSDTLCARLTAGMILSALLSTQKPNVTLNSYLTRLKAMLRWGYQHDLCPDIAPKLSAFPDKSEREKISDKFLEKDELKKLLNGMKVEHWQNLTRLLVLSGLRIGEALALNYDDIDLVNRLIHVTKTFDRTTGTITTPKTADSVRDVYMQKELYRLCRKLLSKAKRQSLECGYQNKIVFCDMTGNRYTYDVYEKYLRENSEKIIGRKITSHVMRHTMTSLFAEAGVPLDVIARRLGHHDSRLTRDIYLHCTQAQQKKDHDAVKNVVLVGI